MRRYMIASLAALQLAALGCGKLQDNSGVNGISAKGDTDEPASEALPVPKLSDPVVMQNEFATYSNSRPYLTDDRINWQHPLIQSAMEALGPGWWSMISYWRDRSSAYKLESESQRPKDYAVRKILEGAEKTFFGWNAEGATLEDIADNANTSSVTVATIEEKFPADAEADTMTKVRQAMEQWHQKRRDAKVRNFIRVLLGEFRDYPEMIRRKLEIVSTAHHYAGAEEVAAFDTTKNLFTQISYPAYQRMTSVMGAMHRWRQDRLTERCQADVACAETIGFNYNFGEQGHGSRRVSMSVAPWSHCEMKFMFSHYLVDGAPQLSEWGGGEAKPEDYEAGYAAYRGLVYDPTQPYDDDARLALGEGSQCTEEDVAYMYNFRGHVNYKALWLESNGLIHNSRRGNTLRIEHDDESYYQHPFASRYLNARQLLGTYLLYPEQDHERMRTASESGGGHILYVTDEDSDGDNISDYRLFEEWGSGDTGVNGGGNTVSPETAASTPSTTGHLSSWNPDDFWNADMGYLAALPTFEERMARFNQALDRHTNWGPTGYYMTGASAEGAAPDKVRFMPTYSPIVACSYDISASSGFAARDFETTHPFESGQTKWMFIMRFATADYYDEQDMKDGKPFDFDRTYFNETSLSNDWYTERALDRFGWVPPADIYANVYFVYGNRGETPVREPVPAPAP